MSFALGAKAIVSLNGSDQSIFLTARLLTSAHETLLRREFFVASALYAMNFVGMGGTGGAVYVGNGKIVGMGVGNFRYSGTYIEQAVA
ncbi:hypothetical protein [Bradyrhizobium sp. DASA03007]|uniref:hypothetical protein n=1 Tax=unclassified Bradyrhizobium TaxID=2631580 RepID=UPI003F71B263